MNILLTNHKKDQTVALVPHDVEQLVAQHYEISFTKGVGVCLGIDDQQYLKAGAHLINKLNSQTFKKFDIIVSPKSIDNKLYQMANPNQIFWFMGYLVNNTNVLLPILKSGAIALCSENINNNGDYLFLKVFQEMMGAYAPVLGAYLLANNTPSTCLPKAKNSQIKTTILILNYSYTGYFACKNALALGCHVVFLDQDEATLKELKESHELNQLMKLTGGELTTDRASFENLMEYTKVTNILISNNQVPTIKTAIRISKEMLGNLLPGSIFIDLASASGSSSDLLNKMNQLQDLKLPNHVKMIALDNLPAHFNNTWSHIYSELVTKILIDNKDLKSTFDFAKVKILSDAIMTFNHYLTNQDIAQSLHLLYTPLNKAQK